METITAILIGMILGGLIVFLIVYKSIPNMMLVRSKSPYDFEKTVSRLQNELEKDGWKTPFVHDLQETMRKFEKDVHRIKVFEICKPTIAYEVLKLDRERIVSALMPCRISVYETSTGEVWISRLNGAKMGRFFNGAIKRSISQAGEDSEKVIRQLITV